MRVTAVSVLLGVALMVAVPAWPLDSAVYHFTGTVSSFDGSIITVEGKTFQLANKCRFLRHFRRNNAFFEEQATSRDVRIGGSVTMRINGNVADKIMVEEWKQ